MIVKPKIDDKRLQRAIKSEQRNRPNQLKKSLGATAEWLRGRIVERTEKGDGLKGRFPSYTLEYKEFRQKEGKQTNFPDLTFDGNMLSNMAVRSNPKFAEIFFPSVREEKKAMGNQKKRPFFGFTSREGKTMIRIFATEFKRNSKL